MPRAVGAVGRRRVRTFSRAAIPPPKVESIVLQRNQLETAALSVAAMRGASWSAIRLLLKPSSGIEVSALSAAACLTEDEMLRPPGAGAHPQRPSDGGLPSTTSARLLSFWDLSARLRSLGLGILIGWRRPVNIEEEGRRDGAGSANRMQRPAEGAAPNELHLCLNPPNKEAKLYWRPTDQIIVMRNTIEDAHDPPGGPQ